MNVNLSPRSTRRRLVRSTAGFGGLLAVAPMVETVHAEDAQATEEANKALLYRIMDDVFNAHDLAVAERYYLPDFIQHNPQAEQGIVGFRAFFGEIFAAFPDWSGRIDQALAKGDRVVALIDWSGTHSGPFMGIPPTRNRVTMRTADMFRVAGGKVAEHWDVVDILPLLSGLGLIPESQAVAETTTTS